MSRLYVCAADHPCTLEGGQFAEADRTLFPVTSEGLVELEKLDAILSDHDHNAGLPLIACHYANNETGVIQPVEEISRIVKANRGVFVLDAVQAAGRITIDMASPMADYLIISSHKLGGPKGAGALIAHADLMMPMPLIRGGGQERGHRSGTESPVNLAGFGAAASFVTDALGAWEAVTVLRDKLEAAIADIAPNAIFFGRNAPNRLPNTLFFGLPGMKAETLQIAFDLAGVSVSPGSACSSGKVGQSHVLAAMGVPSNDGAIRISLGLHNTDDEIAEVVEIFREIAVRAEQVH